VIGYLVQSGVFLALALISLATAFTTTSGGGVAGEQKGIEPNNVLACRLSN
jgi:hypothetical protein